MGTKRGVMAFRVHNVGVRGLFGDTNLGGEGRVERVRLAASTCAEPVEPISANIRRKAAVIFSPGLFSPRDYSPRDYSGGFDGSKRATRADETIATNPVGSGRGES